MVNKLTGKVLTTGDLNPFRSKYFGKWHYTSTINFKSGNAERSL